MSRHHMLPPIIYTPPPKPKKIETRKRRPDIAMLDGIDDADETSDIRAASPPTPADFKRPPAQMPEIESADRKPQGPAGRLSQGMMTALLRVQELKN